MKFNNYRILLGVSLLIIAFIYIVKLLSYSLELKDSEVMIDEVSKIFHDIKYYESYQNNSKSEYSSLLDKPIPSMEALIGENEDVYAWLTIEGTKIDYPIMFTPDDPEFYLRKNFYGDYSIAGTPFFDGRFSEELDNYIIYGHNMKNGTMFADLIKYKEEAFFRKHSMIRLTTLYREIEYEVIAAFYSELHILRNKFPWYEYSSFENKDQFLEFTAHLESESLFPLPDMLKYGDKFITLATCSYHDDTGRFVIIGREVKN